MFHVIITINNSLPETPQVINLLNMSTIRQPFHPTTALAVSPPNVSTSLFNAETPLPLVQQEGEEEHSPRTLTLMKMQAGTCRGPSQGPHQCLLLPSQEAAACEHIHRSCGSLQPRELSIQQPLNSKIDSRRQNPQLWLLGLHWIYTDLSQLRIRVTGPSPAGLPQADG